MRSSRNLFPFSAVALAAAVSLSGCASGDMSAAPSSASPSSAPATEAAVSEWEWSEETFSTIWPDFADAIGSPDPDLVSISVVTDGDAVTNVVMHAVDPDAPSELNEWSWSHGKIDPESAPVDYGGDVEALKANSFPLSAIPVDTWAQTKDTALNAAQVEGGELSSTVTASKLLLSAGDDRVILQTAVLGPRDSKSVRVTSEGDVIEVLDQ